jgi:hypothetical protein
MRARALTIFSMLMTVSAALAQQVENDNAASWYRRAFDKYRTIQISQDEWESIWDYESNPSRGPSETARQAMARLQPALKLALRGAQQRSSNAHIDFSNGPFTQYDYLGGTRQLAQLMRYDFMIKLNDGDTSGAIDRLAGIYRMADHVSDDRVLVGSLVGTAFVGLADERMQMALDQGAIGPAEAGKLVSVIKTMGTGDPLSYNQAVARDRELTTTWMLDRYGGEGGVDRLAKDAQEIPAIDGYKNLLAFLGKPQAELDAALKSADGAMARIVVAFSNPDQEKAKSELAQISTEIKDGKCGPIATESLAHFEKAYQSRLLTKTMLDQRLTLLSSIADGSVDPKVFANAAVWYMRAIMAIEKLDPDDFERVRQYAADHAQSPDLKLAEYLASPAIQEIIATLRDASQIKRCDFKFTRPNWPIAVLHYQPGLRDAARLLAADATRLLHAGDPASMGGTVDRLSIGFRMAGHLQGDKQILSAVVSHASFQQLDGIVAAAHEGHVFNDEQNLLLWNSLANLGTTDSFGYKGALAAARDELRPWLAPEGPQKDEELTKRAAAFLRRCDGDRLWWLLVAIDQGGWRPKSAVGDYAVLYNHVDDRIEPGVVRASLPLAEKLRSFIEHREIDKLADYEWPTIGRIKLRIFKACERSASIPRALAAAGQSIAALIRYRINAACRNRGQRARRPR